MPEQKHRLRENIDWARRFHWIWTLFPSTWKAIVWGGILSGTGAVLARMNSLTAAHWWIFFLLAGGIYVAVWTVVQRFTLKSAGTERSLETARTRVDGIAEV